jgi:hypothetical protein
MSNEGTDRGQNVTIKSFVQTPLYTVMSICICHKEKTLDLISIEWCGVLQRTKYLFLYLHRTRSNFSDWSGS